MAPQSIVVIGASNNPSKMGTMQAASIIKDGYKGKFYPIHLTEKTVLEHKAYKTVSELPETSDVAMFITPAKVVAPYLEELGKIGLKRAIIITAGFREIGKRV